MLYYSDVVKMIFSEFDEESGVSTVTLNSLRYGNFVGHAQLHPEDADHASAIAGCEYAEMRANIKYMKTRLKEVRIQLKTMENYYATISSMRGFNVDGVEARRARRQIYDYRREVQEWKDAIKSERKRLHDQIQLRDDTIAKLKTWMDK